MKRICDKNCFECPYEDCRLEEKDNQISGLSERLRKAIADNGIMQKDLAEMTGITQISISHYCTGRKNPNAPKIIKMCKALNISSDWLLGLKHEKMIQIEQVEEVEE